MCLYWQTSTSASEGETPAQSRGWPTASISPAPTDVGVRPSSTETDITAAVSNGHPDRVRTLRGARGVNS